VVGLFPEGTRSPDGLLQEAHPGVALLAIRAGVPILPVGISGAQRYLPRNRRLPALGTRITIGVGEPFTVGTTDAASAPQRRQRTEAATTEIMSRLAALLAPAQRGRWGAASTDAPVAKAGRGS
jgi:1-acyl-sn-glycerol-3-phosphate acyltransferase